MRTRTCGSRPIGASMLNARRPAPCRARARGTGGWTSRAAIARISAVTAASVRADHHQAARCPCRAGARCRRAAARALCRIAREQAVEQRARPVARRRMHDQAGGLVDHQQVLVLVDDGQRQRLGAEGPALLRSARSSTATRWPARTRCAGAGRRRRRRRCTWPPSISPCRWLRENSGARRDERLVEPLAVLRRRRRVDVAASRRRVVVRRRRRPVGVGRRPAEASTI